MSAIDEGIVREYFEQNGFLVRQVRKYQVQARRKTGDEEVDLVVYNPAYARSSRKPDFFLFANELAYIHRAIVVVKGWHTGRFTPAMLKSSPEIFRFLEENVVKEVTRFFPVDAEEPGNAADVTKILVLPSLPTAEPFRSQSVTMLKEHGVDAIISFRSQSVTMLKEHGVDAIISFRSMLLDIIESVEINKSYGKSDTLQVIRILKNYDLLKDAQLDLLAERPAAPRKSTSKA